jgi:hypothetical protein
MTKKYTIQDREAGNVIEEFNSLSDAQLALSNYEHQDKLDNIYVVDFYEIVENDN